MNTIIPREITAIIYTYLDNPYKFVWPFVCSLWRYIAATTHVERKQKHVVRKPYRDVGYKLAKRGDFNVLLWALRKGIHKENIQLGAARSGNMRILTRTSEITNASLIAAAECGHLSVIEHYFTHIDQDFGFQYFISLQVTAAAAQHGHVNILQWMLADGYSIDSGLAKNAAEGGHIHVLKWLNKNSWPVDKNNVTYDAGMAKQLETFNWCLRDQTTLSEMAVNLAARNGWIDVLRSKPLGAPEIRPFVTPNIRYMTFMNAAISGSMETMEWVINNGFPIDVSATITMESCGSAEMADYMLSIGCHVSNDMFYTPGRALDVMEWGLARGIPITKYDILACIHQCHIDAIELIKKYNAWIPGLHPQMTIVAQNLPLHTVKYLATNGCIFDVDKSMECLKNNARFDLIRYFSTNK
jgi:hypothetical protein